MGIIAGAAGGIAAKVVDFAANAAGKVVEFMGDSLAQASDLSETIGKSEAIFGAQAAAMEEWAATSDTAFGLSQAAALDAAASFGDMFSQIGFTGDQAAGMSTDIVGLAADLGSFNNLETSDVLDKISASFRGEYDSLQSVIPNINAARVANEALAMTGKTNAAELTAQEKATATLAIIQKDGARAAGDFERTSGGAANAQKVFGAQVDNLKAKLGAGLLPILNGVLQFLTGTAMPGISAFADKFGPMFDGVVGGFNKVRDGLSAFQIPPAITDGLTQIGTGIQTHVMPAWDRLRGGFDELTTRIQPIVAEFTGFVQAKFAEWGPTISTHAGTVTQIIGTAMDVVTGIVQRVTQLVGGLWDRWGGTIMAVTGTVFGTIVRVIGSGLGIIQGTFQTVSALLRGDWSGAMDGIRKVTDSMVDGVKNVLGGLINVVGNLFGVDNLTGKITAGFKSAITWINDKFIGGVNNAISKAGIDWSIPRIPGFADGGYTGPGAAGKPAGIVHAGEVVWSQRDVAAWGGPGAVDAMRRWRGYEDGGIVGAIAGAASNVLDFIRDPGSILGNLVDGLLGGADAPGGLAGVFVQALRGLPALIADKIKSFIGGMFSAGRVAPAGGGILPTAGVISSPYGFRIGPFLGAEMHDGVDIAAPMGTPVFAPLPGVVTQAGGAGGYGLMVTLDHGGFTSFYAHLSAITSTVGQLLKAGEMLGLVGSTGWSTGPHLHWGSSLGDPMQMLYDNGGQLAPGVSLVANRTGRPEPVLTAQQWTDLADRLERLIAVLMLLVDRPALDQQDLAVVLAGISGRRGETLP